LQEKASTLNIRVYFVNKVNKVSETIRVAKQTKEALLRVAARLQERTGRRVDFDEAISHLVGLEDRSPDSLMKFIGSVKGAKGTELLKELVQERRRDEIRSKRKYGV
jgi:hypothetical protein